MTFESMANPAQQEIYDEAIKELASPGKHGQLQQGNECTY